MAAEFTEAEKVVEIAKPADLIEFDRGIYQHWAIYVGDGDIVNFGSDPGSGSGSGSDSGSALDSVTSLSAQDKSLVTREKLTDVADSDLCRVNNRLDDKYPARDSELVVSDALRMVGQEVPYSVETWNCEHFVTGLRYYKPESAQVKEKITIAGIVVGAILLFGAGLVGSLIGSTVQTSESEIKIEIKNENEKKQEQEEQKD